ncbi:MAG: hypothetical protein R2848_04705 [Thermomicrobiales bacterium]
MAQAVATLEHAHGAGDIGHGEHADHPPSSTGLDSRKLLMWLFLASDCMFFGSLIAMRMIYRGDAERMLEMDRVSARYRMRFSTSPTPLSAHSCC